MKKYNVKSMLMLPILSLLILGIGYLGIVQGGKLLLNKESEPQQIELKNTSSNVFYGKIEDDIQLFPWNYYPTEQNKEQQLLHEEEEITTYPDNIEEVTTYPDNIEESIQYADNTEETSVYSDYEQEALFRRLIAYGCHTSLENLDAWYQQKETTIMKSVVSANTDFGKISFYEEEITIFQKTYQVRLAFGNYILYHFTCSEDAKEEDKQKDSPKWTEGKEVLTQMLEENRQQVNNQAFLLMELYANGEVLSDKKYGNWYADAYIANTDLLNGMLENKGAQEQNNDWEKEIATYYNKIGYTEKEIKNMINNYNQQCSYQIVEWNDMILILVQGNITMGIFYDPITQQFCGYNYFLR
ncbi:MAG: hypothetical protein RR139_07460 [Lachnospiraceae bacterium]